MSEELLDGTDVVAFLQQVGGKRVTEGMTRGRLGNSGGADGILDSPLEDRFVKVMAAPLAGGAVHLEARGREDPLPSPVSAGARILAQERAG